MRRGRKPRPFKTARTLPQELRTNLTDAWIARTGDVSEIGTGDVPARIRELRVVEYVEEFTPNLKRLRFCDRDSLRDSEIGVVDAGTMEEPTVRTAETATFTG